MAAKPNLETILQTYSLDELLDLARTKARRMEEERLNEARRHYEALTKMIESEESKIEPVSEPEETKPTVSRPRGRKPSGKKKSLGDHIIEVVGSTPMKIDEILAAIRENGYKSKAKDPRRVLYLELKKQILNNNLLKVDRGRYVKNE